LPVVCDIEEGWSVSHPSFFVLEVMIVSSYTLSLDDEVLSILRDAVVESNVLRLPPIQLARPLYERVNKALDAMGGQWNRKLKGHVFADVERLTRGLAQIFGNGQVTNEQKAFGAFFTPPELAAEMVDMAEIESGMRILEPSAGNAYNVEPLKVVTLDTIDVCEINPQFAQRLAQMLRVQLVAEDFLGYQPGPVYERIVANPPFNDGLDIVHVNHMLDCLRPGGVLVTVMSNGFTFRQNKATQALHERLARECGVLDCRDLPEGSFKEAGTGVKTILLTAHKDA
jgi:protein-L-isoaspartate O-methyltransferase